MIFLILIIWLEGGMRHGGYIRRVGVALVIWFFIDTITVSAMSPPVLQTTCSQLVACCMRIWSEIRFQDTVGDVTMWSENAHACLTCLQDLTQKIKDGRHDGLTRENVEYIVHLIDRISVECECAEEQSGSEAAQREFLAMLTLLWSHLRSTILEV